jgi:peptidoglycan/xylan/chitin deacetylase (PgdA/CDA1 family)
MEGCFRVGVALAGGAVLAVAGLTSGASGMARSPGARTVTGPRAAAPPVSASVRAPASASGVAKTRPAAAIVTFTWGGGNADQTTALPIFHSYRMHATFYIPSGLVCVPSRTVSCAGSRYLTLHDVHAIAADGNEIGGLTVLHVPVTGMPAAEAQREICDDRVNLSRWGFTVTDFAYPFGEVNPQAEDLVRRCGYNSGMGTGQLRGAGLCGSCAWAESVPPHNPYLLRTPIEVASVGTVWSPATFESIVEGAQRHGGGWVIFTIHDVCPAACPLGVTPAELRSVLAWLTRQASRGTRVETIGQVIGGTAKPVLPGPAPRPILPPGVTNDSLSASGKGGYPACFQAARFGANTVAYSYHRGNGPGGAATETIHMTRWTSGDAKLLPTLDLGRCAPPVTAGRSYTIGEWYKSTRPTQFDLYYRTSVGNWAYWTSSPRIAPATDWTNDTWTTPALPSGATALSFGLTVGSVGTITITRFSLAPAHGSRGRILLLGLALLAFLAAFIAIRKIRHSKADTPKVRVSQLQLPAGP